MFVVVNCSFLGKMVKIIDFFYLGGFVVVKMEYLFKEKGIICVINGKFIYMYVIFRDLV